MEQQTFTVGEVAIFNRPGSRYHGCEVTITGALHFARVNDRATGISSFELVYGIEGPFEPRPGFSGCCALPEQLKKRYLPPNWREIAERGDLITEEDKVMARPTRQPSLCRSRHAVSSPPPGLVGWASSHE